MGEAVPLRRVLGTERDGVIAANIAEVAPFVPEAVVEKGAAVALGCCQHGRKTMWRKHTAARIVERETKAKRTPLTHLSSGGTNLVGADVIQAPELVVISELAPVGTLRSVFPSASHAGTYYFYYFIEWGNQVATWGT